MSLVESRPFSPWPMVVGDVGGTNARWGWVAAAGDAVAHVWTTPVADHPGPAAAVETYLRRLAREQGMAQRPQSLGVAVATAVRGDHIQFTNSPWGFSARQLGEEVGVERLRVLNDFEALALALPRLRPEQCQSAGPLPQPTGVLAVVGPGTGLGVGAVVPVRPAGSLAHVAGPRWQAIPGEGGHATLAPGNDFESAVLALARRHHEHVSAERLLSGIGLPLLHESVATVAGRPVASGSDARDIVNAALAGDAAAQHTIDVFCAMLGGFCGSVALTLGARSGLYVGGGIVPRLGARFWESEFRARFEAKGRFQGYLQAVPVAVITDTLAALSGVAGALEQGD